MNDTICMAEVPLLLGTDAFGGCNRPSWKLDHNREADDRIANTDATVVTRVLENGGHISGKAACEASIALSLRNAEPTDWRVIDRTPRWEPPLRPRAADRSTTHTPRASQQGARVQVVRSCYKLARWIWRSEGIRPLRSELYVSSISVRRCRLAEDVVCESLWDRRLETDFRAGAVHGSRESAIPNMSARSTCVGTV